MIRTHGFSSGIKVLGGGFNLCSTQRVIRTSSQQNFLLMTQQAAGAPKNRKSGPSRLKSGSASKASYSTAAGKEIEAKTSTPESTGVRLNKCLHELSRRGSDDAIADGRVTINNVVATNGMRVQKRDIVRLVRLIKIVCHHSSNKFKNNKGSQTYLCLFNFQHTN